MSAWSNLINPFAQTIGFAKAPFEKRTDQPWLQGTVRNFAHAGAGDDLSGTFEQKYLGDDSNGYRNPMDDPANQQSGMPGQTLQSAASRAGQTPQSTSTPANAALLAWLKLQQSQGGTI